MLTRRSFELLLFGGGQDKLSWLQRFCGVTPFPSDSLSSSPSLSPNVIPLSSFFFSVQSN